MYNEKVKLGILGPSSAPKLFIALQIAYGLCGSWQRVIVVGSSLKDACYQHLGDYNTLFVPADAPPQRYTELLNLCGGCCKDVIVFSSLSSEWTTGVTQHLSSSYFEELLRAHRNFFSVLRQFPAHVIGCIETKKKLAYQESGGRKRLHLAQHPIQQDGVEEHFTTVLQVDKKGRASVVKDQTGTLPQEQPFAITPQTGALLQDWSCQGKSAVPKDLQVQINRCSSLTELYRLLFEQDMQDEAVFRAFTQRRLELENEAGSTNGGEEQPRLAPIPGGLI